VWLNSHDRKWLNFKRPLTIREILEKLEAQYHCLGDPDLIPEKPFNEFYREDLYRLLRNLEKVVEKRIDPILHK